jgi:hypothetical protein
MVADYWLNNSIDLAFIDIENYKNFEHNSKHFMDIIYPNFMRYKHFINRLMVHNRLWMLPWCILQLGMCFFTSN